MKAESCILGTELPWGESREGRELNGIMSQKLKHLGCAPEEGLCISFPASPHFSGVAAPPPPPLPGKEVLQRLEEALVWTLVRSLEGRRWDKVAAERVVRRFSSECGYLTAEKTDGRISGREENWRRTVVGFLE